MNKGGIKPPNYFFVYFGGYIMNKKGLIQDCLNKLNKLNDMSWEDIIINIISILKIKIPLK